MLDLVLELLAPTRCAGCDAPVGPRVLFCGGCEPSVVPGRDLAAFVYGGAPAAAIARLKYEKRSDLAARLGAVLARTAAPLAGKVDVVVPVPLHPRRLAERGFNPSALLAAPVARAIGARFAPLSLVRTRDTPRQATLDRSARSRNVAGAFAATRDVEGLAVLVVDDVQTTGATLDACARALVAKGARGVIPLVLARKD